MQIGSEEGAKYAVFVVFAEVALIVKAPVVVFKLQFIAAVF